MLRAWLKKHLPNKKTVNNNSSINSMHNYLCHSNVWHLNGSSISRGTAIGLFVAFIPLPLQMLIAAFMAVVFRANLPIAVVMTWITNPFTFIPLNYSIYWVGKKVLSEPVNDLIFPVFSWRLGNVSLFWHSLFAQISQFGKAYFVGLPIVAIGVSTSGYLVVRILWYFTILLSKRKK